MKAMHRKFRLSTRNIYFSKHILFEAKRLFLYPLTVVEAPMGYGKTTLIKEVLKEADSTVLWQKVYDSSPSLFWSDFSNIFSCISTSLSTSLIQIKLPNDSVSMSEAISLIEKSIIGRSVVIVIDDFHIIENQYIFDFITLLVLHEIENLHVVITTRAILLERFEELKLKGYAHHITKEMLEFNIEDIEKYYQICGINLKVSDLHLLYEHTEGWISALYLLMVNYLNEGTFLNLTNIYKIVENTIYLPFSREIREFLLSMCLFDQFTIPQAEFICQKNNVTYLLNEIMIKNAFIKYNQYTGTYQIHNIITNFLKDELSKSTLYNDIYSRTAKWYSKNGNYITAMAYFYCCKDFDGIMQAVEDGKANGINSDDKKELLIKYFSECPTQIKMKYHYAMLIYSLCLYSFNDIPLFNQACDEFNQYLTMDSNLDESTKNNLLGEFYILMSFTVYNDIKAMASYHAMAQHLLNKSVEFIDTFSNFTFGAPSILYMFYRESGKLLEHINDMKIALPYYCNIANGHGSGAQFIFEAEYYYNRGDFVNAEIIVQKAFYPAEQNHQIGIITCGYFLQTRLALVRGDYKTAINLFSNMFQGITHQRDDLTVHTVNICEGFIYSYLNQTSLISDWILDGDFSNRRLLFPASAMLCIVYGRVLLISEKFVPLIGASEYFLEISSVYPNLLSIIYTHIYLSAAYYRLFQEKEALNHLTKALEIALPDSLYMPFVENFDWIKELLLKLSCNHTFHKDIEIILELSTHYSKNIAFIISENFTTNKPILTEREYQIASLAAKGLTNREIGEQLFISTNTVKTQLKSIFDKLNISSRSLLSQYINIEKEDDSLT
jgi:LuxR family maltose regulon positive regulatory protein